MASWLEVKAMAPAIGVALGDGGHGMRFDWRWDRGSCDAWCGDIGIASGLTS